MAKIFYNTRNKAYISNFYKGHVYYTKSHKKAKIFPDHNDVIGRVKMINEKGNFLILNTSEMIMWKKRK